MLYSERELMERVRHWNTHKRVQNPELRLTYRTGVGRAGPYPGEHALAFDSSRPVEVRAVRQYLKRKRAGSEQYGFSRPQSSRQSRSPTSSQMSRSSYRSYKGSDSWDEILSLAIARTATPSTGTNRSTPSKTGLTESWVQSHPSFPIFQFMDDYNPMYTVAGISEEERNRVHMLSSCTLFLRTRSTNSYPQLPPIDASVDSQAMIVLDRHGDALKYFELGKQLEAMQAVDSCCAAMETLVATQQPSLLSAIIVIVSELTSNGKPEFAQQVLQFITELATIRLGQRHPICVFLWCMRASDVAAQRVLTEEFLTRAIDELEKIDARGLVDLINDYQYRLLRVYNEQGKLSAGLDLLKKKAYYYEIHFGHFHFDTLNSIYQIGRNCVLSGDLIEARFNFEDVLQRLPGVNKDAPNIVWLHLNSHGRLAQICKRLNDEDQATEHATLCLAGPNEGEENLEEWWRGNFTKEDISYG